jgi:hypothetical protein
LRSAALSFGLCHVAAHIHIGSSASERYTGCPLSSELCDATPKGTKGMQVTKLGPDGRVLLKLGKTGQGAGLTGLDIFDSPTGVAVASNGDIYISEGHGETKVNISRIMVFSKDGKFIKAFGTRGTGDGQLLSPHALAFESRDHLCVAHRGNSRVVVFDEDGKFLAALKQFGRPSGIAVDKNDMLYVADSQSPDAPGAANYNPGCRRGLRIGSVNDGKVMYFIPPPVPPDPKMQPPIGVWSMASAPSTRRPTTRRTSGNT